MKLADLPEAGRRQVSDACGAMLENWERDVRPEFSNRAGVLEHLQQLVTSIRGNSPV